MPKPPPRQSRDWLNVPEAAQAFEVSAETIRAWIASGKLNAEKVNTYYRIPEREVARLANQLYGNMELPDTPTEGEPA